MTRDLERKDRPRIALVLAGGNALGAYGAGAYEAMHGRGYLPDLISGASIGAINGAIIAGNALERRVDKLREFWIDAAMFSPNAWLAATGRPRKDYNRAHALHAVLFGRPGLFVPRIPGLLSALPGMPRDVAIFDNRPTTATLERVVDFELLNSAQVPLIVNCSDMGTGQPIRFDTRVKPVAPVHFLASSGLAPAFPPVTIDGQSLGDPGFISNLPLDAVLEHKLEDDLLCFAVDLFDVNDERPDDLDGVIERTQDILFAAQSQRTIEARVREHRLRHIIAALAESLPRSADGYNALKGLGDEGSAAELDIVFVAYRAAAHELAAKTLEYSRTSIEERWAAGRDDMHAAIDRLEAGQSARSGPGFALYSTPQQAATAPA